ncbi:MAG: PorV/PorQ family protein [Odoribacter sp.]|nr:PorV/PorQ family protein [Odoribacter sp.]
MNWKIILVSLFGILFVAGNSQGQSVAFLEVAPDARSAALGETGTALSPDAWSVYWNVAKAVVAESKAEIAYSYTPWMRDFLSGSRFHRLGGFWRLSDKEVVVAGFRHFANGEFDLVDEDGLDNGKVRPDEYALEAGYARSLLKGFSAGATIRYIRSDLGAIRGVDPANAVAFDLGTYYRKEVTLWHRKSLVAAGLTFADLGSRIKYADSKYALPARLSVGASLELPVAEHHVLTCAANVAWRVVPSDSRTCNGGVGVEYGLYGIGFFRAGYRWNDMEKSTGGDYVSLGLGVKYWHLFADVAWRLATENYDALDKTFTFSVGVSF